MTEKRGPHTNRTDAVGVRFEPKTRFLAELAARYQGRTISAFIEWCVRDVLQRGQILGDPSTTIDITMPPALKPMWGEALWSETEVQRLFNVASAYPALLTPQQRTLFKLICESEFNSAHTSGGFWPNMEAISANWQELQRRARERMEGNNE